MTPRLLPVRRPFERVKLVSPNQQSRNGVTPRLIVLHSTESVGFPDGWFMNPDANASSNVCVGQTGVSHRYVADERKAWAQAAFNSVALSIEQCGFAAQTHWPDAQVKKAAKYCAYWSKKYGIQLDHRASPGGNGVCEHADLGQAGGGHHDPGEHYPFDELLHHARYYLRRGWVH